MNGAADEDRRFAQRGQVELQIHGVHGPAGGIVLDLLHQLAEPGAAVGAGVDIGGEVGFLVHRVDDVTRVRVDQEDVVIAELVADEAHVLVEARMDALVAGVARRIDEILALAVGCVVFGEVAVLQVAARIRARHEGSGVDLAPVDERAQARQEGALVVALQFGIIGNGRKGLVAAEFAKGVAELHHGALDRGVFRDHGGLVEDTTEILLHLLGARGADGGEFLEGGVAQGLAAVEIGQEAEHERAHKRGQHEDDRELGLGAHRRFPATRSTGPRES